MPPHQAIITKMMRSPHTKYGAPAIKKYENFESAVASKAKMPKNDRAPQTRLNHSINFLRHHNRFTVQIANATKTPTPTRAGIYVSV